MTKRRPPSWEQLLEAWAAVRLHGRTGLTFLSRPLDLFSLPGSEAPTWARGVWGSWKEAERHGYTCGSSGTRNAEGWCCESETGGQPVFRAPTRAQNDESLAPHFLGSTAVASILVWPLESSSGPGQGLQDL